MTQMARSVPRLEPIKHGSGVPFRFPSNPSNSSAPIPQIHTEVFCLFKDWVSGHVGNGESHLFFCVFLLVSL